MNQEKIAEFNRHFVRTCKQPSLINISEYPNLPDETIDLIYSRAKSGDISMYAYKQLVHRLTRFTKHIVDDILDGNMLMYLGEDWGGEIYDLTNLTAKILAVDDTALYKIIHALYLSNEQSGHEQCFFWYSLIQSEWDRVKKEDLSKIADLVAKGRHHGHKGDTRRRMECPYFASVSTLLLTRKDLPKEAAAKLTHKTSHAFRRLFTNKSNYPVQVVYNPHTRISEREYVHYLMEPPLGDHGLRFLVRWEPSNLSPQFLGAIHKVVGKLIEHPSLSAQSQLSKLSFYIGPDYSPSVGTLGLLLPKILLKTKDGGRLRGIILGGVYSLLQRLDKTKHPRHSSKPSVVIDLIDMLVWSLLTSTGLSEDEINKISELVGPVIDIDASLQKIGLFDQSLSWMTFRRMEADGCKLSEEFMCKIIPTHFSGNGWQSVKHPVMAFQWLQAYAIIKDSQSTAAAYHSILQGLSDNVFSITRPYAQKQYTTLQAPGPSVIHITLLYRLAIKPLLLLFGHCK